MPGSSDSFLQAVTRDRRVQSVVMDGLGQLASGRQTARPIPPPRTVDRTEAVPSIDTADMASVPVESSLDGTSAPMDEMQDEILFPRTETAPLPTNIPNLPLNPINAVNDQEFYSRTGRQPTSTDKLLMEAKTRLFQSSGRVPTPKELLYEAQRSVIANRSSNNPSIA